MVHRGCDGCCFAYLQWPPNSAGFIGIYHWAMNDSYFRYVRGSYMYEQQRVDVVTRPCAAEALEYK